MDSTTFPKSVFSSVFALTIGLLYCARSELTQRRAEPCIVPNRRAWSIFTSRSASPALFQCCSPLLNSTKIAFSFLKFHLAKVDDKSLRAKDWTIIKVLASDEASNNRLVSATFLYQLTTATAPDQGAPFLFFPR